MMFKHRDTGELNNRIAHFQGDKYAFMGLVNSPMLDGEVWSGMNEAGFCIMNTASYNLREDTLKCQMDREGELMYHALGACATLEDFEAWLTTYPQPWGVEANFGVIDAQGGAAMFEVDGNSYKMFDANDPDVAPHGYVARTNFSNGGELNKGYGYVRFLEVDRVLSKACAMGGITPQLIFNDIARSFRNNILDIDLRSGDFNYPKTSGWFTDQDFIPRNNTSCSIVVQGVKKGENPELTVLWTILGYPPAGVAVPLWVKDNLPAMMSYDKEKGAAPLSAASLKLADEKVFHFKQGGGTKHYLHWENLYNLKGTGIMQKLVPVEEKVYQEALPLQQKFYKDGKVNVKELDALYGRMENMLKTEGVF